uniref:Odorant receptor n=1 Tax=Microplitis mediator TaxID=375433 RepID=A0A0H4KNZ6_9HYME|nr:odorant receptor 46 [Microplitis mediator]
MKVNPSDQNSTVIQNQSSEPENIVNNEQDFEWAIHYHRKVLKFCGIWIYSNSNRWYLKLITDLHSLFIIGGVLICLTTPEAMALVKIWGNLTLIVDNLLSSAALISTQIKLFVLWTRRKAIARIVEAVKSDWLEPKTEAERKIMRRYARIARIMMVCGLSNIAYNLITFHGSVLFGFVYRTVNNITDIEGYLIPTQSVFPFDITIGYRCWIIRIVQALQCFGAGITYTAIDVFCGMSVLHNCGQLEILADKIKDLVNPDEPRVFQELLKTIVLRHYRIIGLIEEIRNIFATVLLLLVLCFGILFSVIGFLIASSFESDGTKVPVSQMNFYIGYILFFVGLLFVYSWVGENLLSHSEEIHVAVYSCNWTDLEPHQIAQLIIILVRAQRPLEITIGKFAPATLNTFAQILKTSAGYISVLLARNG